MLKNATKYKNSKIQKCLNANKCQQMLKNAKMAKFH